MNKAGVAVIQKTEHTVQFWGRTPRPDLQNVWKTLAEGKVKFFLWLMLQNRNWTADRLRARGWPHDDLCCLCSMQIETANHIALHCPYAGEVRNLFHASRPAMVEVLDAATSIQDWWCKARARPKGSSFQSDIAIAVYIFWHVWKERGRRIFQKEELPAAGVAALVRSDIELLFIARRVS